MSDENIPLCRPEIEAAATGLWMDISCDVPQVEPPPCVRRMDVGDDGTIDYDPEDAAHTWRFGVIGLWVGLLVVVFVAGWIARGACQ